MKIKRLVVILMVLIFSTVGLFASIAYEDIPNAVATLKANIGEFLYHGFADSELDTTFESTLTVEDAFTAAPSFWYGYKTNAIGTYVFRMKVTDFENQTTRNGSTVVDVVKIRSVVSSDHGTTAMTYDANGYKLFEEESAVITTSTRSNSTQVTITPVTTFSGVDHKSATIEEGQSVADAAAGEYVATVTFSVSAT